MLSVFWIIFPKPRSRTIGIDLAHWYVNCANLKVMFEPQREIPTMAGNYFDGQTEPLPSKFALAVILKRSPASNPWSEYQWDVIGVTAGSSETDAADRLPHLVSEHGEVALFKAEGFGLQLYVDECESYYHNLVSPRPRCFVIAEADAGDGPVPFRVSLSFDEAHAYLEGEGEVFAVDMPPELYRWSEAFVLQHYVPERKTKRKLHNWSDTNDEV